VNALRAPFPWFGGKSRAAPLIWERFGDVASYCEPFAGSLAVLLGRPATHLAATETTNDKDGFVANAWRAILHDPDATAHSADWPVNETDLHARHAWLVEQRATLEVRLEGDPEYFDARIAGWWLWGIACWIGGGFCSGDGPWVRADGNLVHLGDAGRGVHRQLVHLGNAGQGVHRQLVHLGDAGRGVRDWLASLSERLRRVRVCSGDWSRVVTPAALQPSASSHGILLDPPYSAEAGRRATIYACEDQDVAHAVRAWCLAAPAAYRIALCGYEGEGHEALTDVGWSCESWVAPGGMQRDKDLGGNRTRERIWFSPACMRRRQGELFAEAAE